MRLSGCRCLRIPEKLGFLSGSLLQVQLLVHRLLLRTRRSRGHPIDRMRRMHLWGRLSL